MAGFLYYIPNDQVNIVDHEFVNKHGLAYAFADHKGNPTGAPLNNGPDTGSGTIVAGIGVKQIKYVKTEQTWRKYKNIWVGYWLNDKPGPSDLLRSDAINGHAVTLSDDQQWIVPVARALAETDDGQITSICNLTRKVDIDEDGNWIYSGVIARCEKLWSIACEFWDKIVADQTTQKNTDAENNSKSIVIEFDDQADYATDVLQFNYRISKIEAVMLNMIGSDTPSHILEALVDIPTLKDWTAKKKLEAQPAG